MSTTIDEKVVEMRFDNRDFEKNVKTSMNTIDSLKKSLNFDDTAKSFSALETASKKVRFEGITDAIETVKVKFSYLQMAALNVFNHIIDDAYYMGKRLANSLSIDQISSGWDKYALKTSAVQTIMAATAKDFKDTGEQMEFVNDQLNKLNWYTDETSYNFVDMTSNIGKFTSNNVKLEDAVTAMQGIANWAAVSGANVNEASRAMYNLSQALAMGEVKLMDWRSIENANMATYEFKQMAIDTAVQMKTLTKISKDLYAAPTGKKYTTLELFSEGLRDSWFTKDVLIKVLQRYGEFTDKMYEATEELDMTATDMLTAIEKYKEGSLNLDEYAQEMGVSVVELSKHLQILSDDTYELGRKAFRAGQEAKTFQEAIDAVKDAASTSWMNIFEQIFGDYEGARKTWTNLANELYDVFVEPIEANLKMIKTWKAMGGNEILFQGIANFWTNFRNIIGAVKDGFHDIFPKYTAATLFKITRGFRDLSKSLMLSEDELEKIRRIFKGLTSLLDIGRMFLSAVWNEVKTLVTYVKSLSDGLLDGAANLGDFLTKVRDWIKENQIFEKGIERVVKVVIFLANAFDSLIQKLTGYGIVDLVKKLGDNLKYFYNEVSLIVKLLFGHNTPKEISNLIKQFKDLTGMDFKDSKLFSFLAKTKQIFRGFKTLVSDLVRGEGFGDAITKFFGATFGADTTFFDKVGDSFKKGWSKVSESFASFKAGFGDFAKIVGDRWDKIKKSFSDAKDVIVEAWGKIKEVMAEITGKDIEGMTTLGTVISVILYPIQLLFTGLKYLFQGLGVILSDFGPTIVEFIKKIAKGLLDLGKALKDSIFSADFSKFIDLVTSGSLAIILGKLAASLLGVGKAGKGLKSLGEIDGKFSFLEFLKNLYTYSKKMGKTISETFSNILGGVKDVLVAWQKDLQANVIFKIAAAIGILAAALLVLSSIDESKLTSSIGAITALFTELVAAFKILTMGNDAIVGAVEEGPKGLLGGVTNMLGDYTQLAAMIISISAAVLIMAIALKKVSNIEPDRLKTGLLGITALLSELLIFLKFLQKNEKSASVGIKGMVNLALGLYVMALTVKKLAKLDTASMVQGLVGLGVILTLLLGFVKLLGTNLKSAKMPEGNMEFQTLIQIANGMLILSVALKLIVSVVKKLGKMEVEQLEQGLLGFGVILATIAGFIYLLRFEMPKNDDQAEVGLMRVANMMLVMSVAMTIMAGALKIIGSMDFEHVSVALIGFAGSIGVMILAFENMKNEKASELLKTAAAITIFANAFVVLAMAMKLMSTVEIGGIIKSLGIVTYIFSMIAIFSAFTEGNSVVKAAGAMLLIANALLVLTPSLLMISKIDLGGLIMLVSTLTAVLFVIGLFTDLMAGKELTLLAVSGSFALIGVGLLALGAGFTVLAAGLVALGGAMPILGEFLILIIKLIPKTILSIFEGVFEAIVNYGAKILAAIINALNTIIGPAIELIFNFVDALMAALAAHLPSIAKNIIDLALDLLDVLGKSMAKIVDRLWNLALNLVEALGETFRKNSRRLMEVVASLIGNILLGALDMVFPWIVDWITGGVDDVIDVMDVLSEEEKALIDRVNTAKSAYDEMDASRQQHMGEISSEYQYIEELKDEYNKLVDSEGRIKAGYETRAETIKTLLAEAMGIGVDQIEAMIGANGRLEKSFDGVLAKMKAEAFLEANKDSYMQAIQNRTTAYEDYKQALDAYSEADKEVIQLEKERERYNKIVEDAAARGITDTEEAHEAAYQRSLLDKELEKARRRRAELAITRQDAEEYYRGLLRDVDMYENTVSAIENGTTEDMSKAVEDYADKFYRNGAATRQQLVAQVQFWKDYVKDLRTAIKNGEKVSEEEIEHAERRLGEANGELFKYKAGWEETAKESGKRIVHAQAEGITENKSVITDANEESVSEILKSFGMTSDAIHLNNENITMMTEDDLTKMVQICSEKGPEAGMAFVNNFSSSIEDGEEKITKSVEKTADKSTKKTVDYVGNKGGVIGQGFIDGWLKSINSRENVSEVEQAAIDTANHFIALYAKTAEIHSPSRVMYRMGTYLIQGLLNGINSLKPLIGQAAEDTANEFIDIVSNTMNNILDGVFQTDMEFELKIKPILDMSELDDNSDGIEGMLKPNATFNVASEIGRKLNMSLSERLKNGFTVNNNDVVDAIGGLRGDVNNLNDNMSKLRVVMDTGALVGQLLDPIDYSIGQKTLYKRRGV